MLLHNFTKRKTLTILLIFSGLFSFGQASITKRVAEIQTEFKLINDSPTWSIDTVNLDVGAEGGEMLLYKDQQGKLKKIWATYYGETIKYVEEFYIKESKLFFAFTREYKYNRPIYWDEETAKESGDNEVFDLSKSVIRENRFYFDRNENLIQWIDENKQAHFSELQLKEKSLEVKKEFEDLKEIAILD